VSPNPNAPRKAPGVPHTHNVPSVLTQAVIIPLAVTCFQLVNDPTCTGLDLSMVSAKPSLPSELRPHVHKVPSVLMHAVLLPIQLTCFQSVNDPTYAVLRDALTALARKLAQMIVRDGEGATKFMTIEVLGGKTPEECRLVAKAVAHSPLVKTAFFASDPNLGRILAAIGYAGITDLDVNRVQMWLGDVWVVKNGGRNPDYQETDGQRIMQAPEITVKIDLGRGASSQTMWTCDLSHDYVSINADYRS
jgi:hypothetical protein